MREGVVRGDRHMRRMRPPRLRERPGLPVGDKTLERGGRLEKFVRARDWMQSFPRFARGLMW